MHPPLDRVDHVHVFVSDRAAAERWYGRVLGLSVVPALRVWAADGGPLTLADASGSVHLALFEKTAQPCRSTIAFGVSAAAFAAWRAHLERALERAFEPTDHDGLARSLYFADPDGNPYEITTYQHGAAPRLPEAAAR